MFEIFINYMEKGGMINGLIFLACFVTIYIGIGRFFLYHSLKRSGNISVDMLEKMTKNLSESSGKSRLLSELLYEIKSRPVCNEKYYYNRFRGILLEQVPKLEEGLDTMAALIAIAPLLGLLGTVVGMIKTFAIITEFGVGNPNLLSEGISVALITTQAGLLVAFPCLLFHNYLKNKKDAIVKNTISDGERILSWSGTRGKVCLKITDF